MKLKIYFTNDIIYCIYLFLNTSIFIKSVLSCRLTNLTYNFIDIQFYNLRYRDRQKKQHEKQNITTKK